MADRTNRYKKPTKRAAYEHALKLVKEVDPYDLPGVTYTIARQLDSSLGREDRRQVAAKALRVERGRRRIKR